MASKYIAIAKNIRVFFFAFEPGFNKSIQKIKEFFLNIATNFLTLTNLDAQSLIKEVLGEDPYSFIKVANTILDKGLEIIDYGPLVQDDPPLKHVGAPSSEKEKGPNPSFPKPLRAPRLNKRKINVYFLSFLLLF